MVHLERNNKMVIGFDMDGVILNNAAAKIKIAKKMGVNLLPKQTPSEIISKFLEPHVYENFKNCIYDDPKIALSPSVMKGVRGILSSIKKKKIPYFLISRRDPPTMAFKILKKYELWPKYFNKENTFFVIHPEDKNVEAARLGITHYIDDELKVINVLSSVPNRFLFDQFNVFEKADYYTKIKSWAEFKKLI